MKAQVHEAKLLLQDKATRKYDDGRGSKDASLREFPRIFIGSFPGNFHLLLEKCREKLIYISKWPFRFIAVKLT